MRLRPHDRTTPVTASNRQEYAGDTVQNGSRPRPSLVRKSAWSASGAFAGIAARLFTGIVTARVLGPTGAGHLAYLLWVADLLWVVTTQGIQSSLSRHLAELSASQEAGQREALLAVMARWYLYMILLGAAAMTLIASRSADIHGSTLDWCLLASYLAARTLGTLYTSAVEGSQRFDLSARVNWAASVAMLIGVTVGTVFAGQSGAVAGYFVSSLVPAVFAIRTLRFRGSLALSSGLRDRARRYAVETSIAGVISAIVWSRTEIYFLARFRSPEEVAQFAIGLSMAALATQGPLLFSGALTPHFAQQMGEADQAGITRVYAQGTRLLAFLLFPACFGTAALLPVLLPLLYGAVYRPAIPGATILVATAALTFANVGSSLVYGVGRSRFIVVSGIVGALISILLAFLVIPTFGVVGAALSRSAVQISMIAWGSWYIQSRLGAAFPLKALVRTAIAAVLAATAAHAVVVALPKAVIVLPAVTIGVVVYILAVRWFSILEPSDARLVHTVIDRLPNAMVGRAQSLAALMLPAP